MTHVYINCMCCLLTICGICATFSVFLTTTMAKATTTDLWIGLNSVAGSRFYWTDGRPMRYNNWGSAVSGHYVFCIVIFNT